MFHFLEGLGVGDSELITKDKSRFIRSPFSAKHFPLPFYLNGFHVLFDLGRRGWFGGSADRGPGGKRLRLFSQFGGEGGTLLPFEHSLRRLSLF